MSISGVLIRFLGAYVVLMIGASNVLRLLGITSSNMGVDTAVLIGAVLWSCRAFGVKNNRYFTAPEKTKVILGLIVVDLSLQIFLAWIILAITGEVMKISTLAFALVVVAVLHSLVIVCFVDVGSKLVAKHLQKQVVDE